MSTKRVAGIDVARALAILLMIQAHASDAWTAPEFRGFGYEVSRFFATFPLPAFLMLAGTGLTWRLYKAEREREPLGALKHQLARRGLSLVATGYMASAAYAMIDGFSSWGDVLRADVLHVIGLSIALAAWLVPSHPRQGKPVKTFVKRVCLVGVVLTLLSPLLPAFDVPFALAVPLGLFVDAAPITRMPLTPIFAWLAVGAAAAYAMKQGQAPSGLRGSSPKRLLQIGLVGLFLLAGYLSSSTVAGRCIQPATYRGHCQYHRSEWSRSTGVGRRLFSRAGAPKTRAPDDCAVWPRLAGRLRVSFTSCLWTSWVSISPSAHGGRNCAGHRGGDPAQLWRRSGLEIDSPTRGSVAKALSGPVSATVPAWNLRPPVQRPLRSRHSHSSALTHRCRSRTIGGIGKRP